MATFILRRLLAAIPLLLGVSVVSFLLLHALPGDPRAPFSASALRLKMSGSFARARD
jgi:ABC-type dipeptide/oligopeptide/nickel transport system permease component